MAGPSSSLSRTCVCWSPGFATKLLIRLFFSLLALDFLAPGIAGHLIRSPNQSNLTTTPLANLTPQQLNFDSFNISGALYSPISSYISLPSLPPTCSMYNVLEGECPTYMMAVNVTYDDCNDAWTLCHCSSANMSFDDAVEKLGKVPVGLRKYIATTIILPGEETHAYSLTNGDLHMFGDCSMETWLHEATHSYDYVYGDPISGSQAWQDAISIDSCATDTYGASNAAEEFAQMSVLKIFSLIYGALPSGWNPTCMSNQFAYFDALPLYDKTTLFSSTCAASTATPDTPDGRLVAVRPIKTDGHSFSLDAPLRINPNTDPKVRKPSNTPETASPSSTLVPPISVGEEPGIGDGDSDDGNRKGNAALPQSYSSTLGQRGFLYMCITIVLVWAF